MLKFFGRRYRTLNTVKVDASALRHNLRVHREALPGKSICPVLKSNAYGHDLVSVAKVLDAESPDFMIVDSLYEAYEIEKAGLQTPVLILGYTFPENLTRKRLPFHFAISDLASAEALAKNGAKIHLKIDTGMNRMGFNIESLPSVLEKLKTLDLEIVGLFTHFADADNSEDETYTLEQLARFKKAIEVVRNAGFTPRWIHCGGSGSYLKENLPEINMVRLGLGLYGLSPLNVSDPHSGRVLNLHPAMEVVSTLVGIRTLQKGDRVSYNGTFTASRPMRIGVIPFGYYEGLPRSLSNRGSMEVKGEACPIVGRICMNYTIIDLGEVEAKLGDEVVVYSPHRAHANSLNNLAKLADTIPYELMVRVAESVRREVVWKERFTEPHSRISTSTSAAVSKSSARIK